MNRNDGPRRFRRRFLAGYVLLATAGLSPCGRSTPAAGQTFQPEPAVDTRACTSRWYGTFCQNVHTERLGYQFTENNLSRRVFSETWSVATHCTRYNYSEGQCERSVSAASDVNWHRVVWGKNGQYYRSYGVRGAASEGPGRLLYPLGVDMGLRVNQDYHVAFIADAGNDRVVVVVLNTATKTATEIGSVDGTESGLRFSYPSDVSWDGAYTATMSDDRLFVADTKNDRVVGYHIAVDPVNGTFSKSYLGSFGTKGSGAWQLDSPMGIDAITYNTGQWTTVYVSDTGNGRVAAWSFDSPSSTSPPHTVQPIAHSQAFAGSQFVGLTRDHYGDVYVADRGRNRILKLSNQLQRLKEYGGGGAWQYGDFDRPSDVHVVHSYTDPYGGFAPEGLRHIQTSEQWSATTGGQMHQLGVDVENLQVQEVFDIHGNANVLQGWFTFTGAGRYQVSIYAGPNLVRALPAEYTGGGSQRSIWWDGRNQYGNLAPAGNYRLVVAFRSLYSDDTVDRVVEQAFMWGYPVQVNVPDYVYSSGSYGISGVAPADATSWVWERQDVWPGYSSGYYYLANSQHTSTVIYREPSDYTIDWRLTVTGANGRTGVGSGSTYVPAENACGPQLVCLLAPREVGQSDTTGSGAQRAGNAVPSRSKALVRMTPDDSSSARQENLVPARQRDHFGGGAWIGRPTGSGPRVVQLYSLAGVHATQGSTWPNALGAPGDVVQETGPAQPGRFPARVEFHRQSRNWEREDYTVRFSAPSGPSGASQPGRAAADNALIGLALDPDLGANVSDDRLGVDASGLVWVTDPDSGAVGYVMTDLPRGARPRVRQYSSRRDSYHPDPAADSAAYSELAAEENRTTGRPGDVRFLLSVGSVSLDRDVVLGLVVLRASSLEALRQLAAGVPRSGVARDIARPAGRTGITRFHLTQAPPSPNAAAGVRSISPAEVPGLDQSTRVRQPVAASLRELVRQYGITALAFAVPDGDPARVQVMIHDPRGRVVRRLLDETRDPGAYRVQWDGEDERGARVSPGVYIAVMEAPGFRATTRLVVVP